MRLDVDVTVRSMRNVGKSGGCSAGIALQKLATLHEALGQPHEAAHYYRQNLTRIDAAGLQGSDRQDALLFLANYKKASICLSAVNGSPWQ